MDATRSLAFGSFQLRALGVKMNGICLPSLGRRQLPRRFHSFALVLAALSHRHPGMVSSPNKWAAFYLSDLVDGDELALLLRGDVLVFAEVHPRFAHDLDQIVVV